jgi:microcin C transport system permease protein
MMGKYIVFDFGDSFFKGRPVVDLILERMPVSISLGFWTFLITYIICIPLGISKAIRDGSRFDTWTSVAILGGSAIPGFLFAILLIVFFAGGRYFNWFPLSGLFSDNWDQLSWPGRIVDYFWHMTLPLVALLIGAFASLTMLTKNSFRIRSGSNMFDGTGQGLTESRVCIIAVPERDVDRRRRISERQDFVYRSLLIETIFPNGPGYLGSELAINRFPMMFTHCISLRHRHGREVAQRHHLHTDRPTDRLLRAKTGTAMTVSRAGFG